MRLAILLTLSLLVACNKERKVKILERQYDEVAKYDSSGERRCSLAEQIASEWLDLGDEKKYKDWSLLRDISCLHAKTIRNL